MIFTKKRLIIICALFVLLVLVAAGLIFILGKIMPAPPASKEIEVPFTSQAPQGNWHEPWQNACEEASIVMIQNFYKDTTLDPAQARQQILDVFTLKKLSAPASKDESLERIAEIINSGDLTWQARVVDNPSLAEIKEELAANHPVIAPVYAPLLKNPNYTSPGPSYHVIVIVGYDDAKGEFITNDPGTDQGQDYSYPYDVLMNALHDYLANKDYTAGAKRVLFTKPN